VIAKDYCRSTSSLVVYKCEGPIFAKTNVRENSFFQYQLAGYDIAEFEQFIFARKYIGDIQRHSFFERPEKISQLALRVGE
jgi:hypothetical protein